MVKLTRRGILFFCFWFTHQARSWPPEFGMEITLEGAVLRDEANRFKIRDQFRKEVLRSCSDCILGDGQWIINNKLNWEIFVAADQAVIEVNSRRGVIEKYRAAMNFLDSKVYDLGREVFKLTPHEHIGGGHVTVDIKSAFSSPLQARNFQVDLRNNGTIFLSAIGFHKDYAARVEHVDDAHWSAFKKYLGIVDKELKAGAAPNAVYKTMKKHSIAKGMIHVDSKRDENGMPRFVTEIRPLFPQKNAAYLVLVLELLQHRIEYVNQNADLISLNRPSTKLKVVTKGEVVDAFYKFVVEPAKTKGEARKLWRKFKPLLHESLDGISPSKEIRRLLARPGWTAKLCGLFSSVASSAKRALGAE